MSTASFVRLASLSQLQAEGPYALSANELDVVLVRTPAGLRAFEGRCPHRGALLAEGELEGDWLVCRNHGWRFSTESGKREGGPQCLASFPVIERDGTIFVDVSAAPTGPSVALGVRTLDDLAGPKGLPLLGNFLQLDVATRHLILERWAAQYGRVYVFRVGSKPVVVLSDPKWCDQVLRARPEIFTRASQLAPVFSELGIDGVFSAEGDAWRMQRRLAVSALAPSHFREMYPKLKTVATRLKKRWEKAADAGSTIEIVEDLKRFTVDVTTLITFGHDINTIEQSEDVIQDKLALVFPAVSRRVFALFPTWRLIRLADDRRLDNAIAELRVWLSELVAIERARQVAEPDRADKPSNFLEAMVSARDDEGRPFSDDRIFGNLMTMLLAGEDTTAYTLGWAVHELCDSPDSVARLRQEADQLLGTSEVASDIETAKKLVWAESIANETMRLRPVAPIVAVLETKMDTVVGDLLVPEGTRVALLMRPASRAPSYFVEPYSFLPERWLGEIAGAHDVSAHIPFGSGPRICPGRLLAILEMKLLLSMLYKTFDVERVGKAEEVKEKFAFTMAPTGLKVRLRRR